MRTRYRFLYRVGTRYHWESVQPLRGDSRHEHVECDVNWFWGQS